MEKSENARSQHKQQNDAMIMNKNESNGTRPHQKIKVIFLNSKSCTSIKNRLSQTKSEKVQKEEKIQKMDNNKDGEKQNRTLKNITKNILRTNFFIKSTSRNKEKKEELNRDSGSNSEIYFSADSSLSSTPDQEQEGKVGSQNTGPSLQHSEESRQGQQMESKYCEPKIIITQSDQHTNTLRKSSFVALKEEIITVDSLEYKVMEVEEEDLHEYQADDPKLLSDKKVGLFDIIVAVYEDDDELDDILNTTTGISGYIGKYWAGFFPLLIVKICPQLDHDDCCPNLSDRNLELLSYKYASFHHLLIDSMADHVFLIESIVRYHQHVSQCTKDLSAAMLKTARWKCSQGCGLRSSNYQDSEIKGKKKKTFLRVLKNSLQPVKLK